MHSLSTPGRLNWNSEVLVFSVERRKLENQEKNPQCKDKSYATTKFTKFVILGRFMWTFKSISHDLNARNKMSKNLNSQENILNGTHYKGIKHPSTTRIGEVCHMKLTLKVKNSHNKM